MKKLREEKGMMEIAAILVIVVIMGMGVAVYNSAKVNTIESNNKINEMEIQIFNSQFIAYSGTGISGSQVRSLISAIISSNATNSDHIISVATSTTLETSTASELTKINQEIKAAYKYTVEVEYDSEGYIYKVIIK